MSAIFGIYNLDDRSLLRADVESMAEILAHRGPDGAGVWQEGSVGLGHRMLWTTPESLHEELPFTDKARELTITADARIDNRDELMEMLGVSAETHGEWSDSQFILAAYVKWGEDCAQHLLGDFAFVIWDEGNRKLFCARDHFGLKPFYYYYAPGKTFAFATEIKALLCLPGVPRKLNELQVAEYLTESFDDSERTLYQDILRLTPAHTMTVTRSEKRQHCYWRLDPSIELRLGSDAEYAEEFRRLFREAVKCRMRSAIPIGSMLSGGLDSSSIACMAREINKDSGQPIHTFSGYFDKVRECDERPFYKTVLAKDGFTSHSVQADSMSPLNDVTNVWDHVDEACSAGNHYISWSLYRVAQSHNVRVVLDGFDGDTTVSHGTGYMRELALSRRWVTLAREAGGYAKNIGESPIPVVLSWFLSYGVNPIIDKVWPLKVVRHLWRKGLQKARRQDSAHNATAPLYSFVKKEFADEIQLKQRIPRQSAPRTERERHHRLFGFSMVSTLELLNLTAGAFSCEVRFPFWDKRLIEFCLSLPPEQKLNRGWGRVVMRRAMEGILPPEIQWRGGKTNMHPGFEHGLFAFEEATVRDVVQGKYKGIEKYVDFTVLQDLYRRYQAGQATPNDVNAMWRATSLGLWLQHTGLTP